MFPNIPKGIRRVWERHPLPQSTSTAIRRLQAERRQDEARGASSATELSREVVECLDQVVQGVAMLRDWRHAAARSRERPTLVVL